MYAGDRCPKYRAESLVLSWCEDTEVALCLARWEMEGWLTDRVCVLVLVALALRREGETTGFVNVE